MASQIYILIRVFKTSNRILLHLLPYTLLYHVVSLHQIGFQYFIVAIMNISVDQVDMVLRAF